MNQGTSVGYDEALATRIRRVLARRDDVVEKHMFGGVAFMVRGHMSCGITGSRLMVRVPPEDADRLLAEPHARPMDFTGRPLKGFLYVEPEGIASAADLRRWLERGLALADSLPARTKRAKQKPGEPPRGKRKR